MNLSMTNTWLAYIPFPCLEWLSSGFSSSLRGHFFYFLLHRCHVYGPKALCVSSERFKVWWMKMYKIRNDSSCSRNPNPSIGSSAADILRLNRNACISQSGLIIMVCRWFGLVEYLTVWLCGCNLLTQVFSLCLFRLRTTAILLSLCEVEPSIYVWFIYNYVVHQYVWVLYSIALIHIPQISSISLFGLETGSPQVWASSRLSVWPIVWFHWMYLCQNHYASGMLEMQTNWQRNL